MAFLRGSLRAPDCMALALLLASLARALAPRSSQPSASGVDAEVRTFGDWKLDGTSGPAPAPAPPVPVGRCRYTTGYGKLFVAAVTPALTPSKHRNQFPATFFLAVVSISVSIYGMNSYNSIQ